MTTRRAFVRAGEEARRAALIDATLDLIAEGGYEAATVRAIALRAGVTAGLIRHYFATKDDLIGAAHEVLMSGMIDAAEARLADLPADPALRLTGFLRASVTPPVIDARSLSLWAAVMQQVPRSPALQAVHRQTYLEFRNRLESLIADVLHAHGRPVHEARDLAICGNAILDGLWIEASALPQDFDLDHLFSLTIKAFSRLLDIPLELA